jgi:hypothetical protein
MRIDLELRSPIFALDDLHVNQMTNSNSVINIVVLSMLEPSELEKCAIINVGSHLISDERRTSGP